MSTPTTGVGVGALDTVVLDCPDPRALAQFYAGLLGTTVSADEDTGEDGSWVSLEAAPGGVALGFQRASRYEPPAWPDGPPQQLHLDVAVTDLVAAHDQVLALGARPLDPVADPQPGDTRSFRVYADPAGHPFCLCRC
ncbi:VOC family protein [Oryzihumus sp.]|uniref:VOC family protein n=1 Tax=Oryzihumus sp. TaxID=1968903 RepID=UPI002EDB5994